jgi:competence protein ComEC
VNLLRRKPAVSAAILFIGGIFLHRSLSVGPGIMLSLALGAGLLAALAFRRQLLSTSLIAFALILLSAAAAQQTSLFYAQDEIGLFTSSQPRLAELEVMIDDPPRLIASQHPFLRQEENRQVTRGGVQRIRQRDGAWARASGTVLLNFAQPIDSLRINQHIRLTGMLHRPAPAMNPGQFDWANYYRDDRILAGVSVRRADGVTILSDPGPSALAKLRAKSRDLLAAGFTKDNSLDHALLQALVLGDTDPELRDVQEDFRRTGTSHHLAISGMHVAMLGLLVYGVCRALRLRPRFAVSIGLATVLLYAAVVLPSAPVIRSVLLCIVFAIGLLMGRSIDGLNLLAITVIAMLVYHPLDLYNAGFQLSFGTVAGLMVFTRFLQPRIWRPNIDEQVVISLLGPGAPRKIRFKHWMLRHASAILAAGFVAWTISQPLVMHHFAQSNPWAILGSIVLALFVFLALMGGFLKLILSLLIPGLDQWWAAMAGFFIMLMRKTVELLGHLPWSDLSTGILPIGMMILIFALLLLPFVRLRRPRLQRTMQLGPIACIALILFLPFTGGFSTPGTSSKGLTVTTLSVGAGLCCVIELPDGNVVLIDAGSSTITDLHRKTIAPFMRARARRSAQCLFLSHRDYDHISAATDAVESLHVSRVFVSPHFERQSGQPGKQVLSFLSTAKTPLDILDCGDTVPLSSDVSIKVLWPPPDCDFSSNDTGLVLRLTYAGRTILFPADIQSPAQLELLKNPAQLKADILLAPHHGSFEPTTLDFVRAVHPSIIISSADNTPTQKQKYFAQIARRAVADRFYQTHRHGAVTVQIDPKGNISVHPFIPEP